MQVTNTRAWPRLCDTAEQAALSPATLSRVLTGSAGVRPETRSVVEGVVPMTDAEIAAALAPDPAADAVSRGGMLGRPSARRLPARPR